MENVTLGKRLVPVEQIALVEVFDPASNPGLKTEKPFRARIVLVNRESILTEIPPQAFAETPKFRWLLQDSIGINPALFFKVEAFAATESFTPTKPYASRIKWSDCDGNEQSKLLLTAPEMFIAQVVRGEGEASPLGKLPGRPVRSRSGQKKMNKLESTRG